MTTLVFLGSGQRVGLQSGTTLIANSNGWASAPDRNSVRAIHDAGNGLIPDVLPVVPTAGRPTADLQAGLTIFDSTLGKPIWLKNLTPTWVDATGAAV